jgi:hypothetical protein
MISEPRKGCTLPGFIKLLKHQIPITSTEF